MEFDRFLKYYEVPDLNIKGKCAAIHAKETFVLMTVARW